MNAEPFVGPRPFEKEDRDRFFGRTRELEELLSLIIAHRAVLVYAQSGAGKTSLLKAGVLPRLEQQGYTVLPPARVQGVVPDGLSPDDVSNIFAFCVLQDWAKEFPALLRSPADYAKKTLPEFLREVAAAKPNEDDDDMPSPIVLIFDQFEEFFTAFQHRWQERTPFFQQLGEALQEIRTLKVVFVMREE